MTGTTETQDDVGAVDARAVRPPDDVAHLFVLFECDRPMAAGARYGLSGVGQIVIGRGPVRAVRRESRDGVVTLIVDVPGKSMSRRHARLVCARGTWTIEDLGSRNGTFVDGTRIERTLLRDGGDFELGHTLFRLALRVPTPTDTLDLDLEHEPPGPPRSLVPVLDARSRTFERIASSNVTLHLCGETGTGKELHARAAHAMSRPAGPFVVVQCGALSTSHAQHQLLGTDFVQDGQPRSGIVRSAHGGTLFLDEVGDLPVSAQAALLRTLEVGEVVPLGASSGVSVDFRLIWASQEHLDALAAVLRRDLLARLAGHTHVLAPLCERTADLGTIIAHVLRSTPLGEGVSLTTEAGWALLRHAWPLHAREVRKRMESATVLAGGGPIHSEHLGLVGTASAFDEDELRDAADDALRQRLEAALRAADGNVAAVGRALGKGPTQIHRWMKRFAIRADSYRTRCPR